ncbi:Uncharacterized conserved protein, DUF983 family [Jannaschia faecimaris]|uniref:Uncharacterized conserved protein, DUF983 family n=1 Tax=Jannaschia faecimaris TaxID=1244108 RepID=A0A1H3RDE8_9RHOB|nr:DUF983 domain-containing protein [Jannaschia faecimaris]SDZ23862.1 Uncharacterized conserved protein, DUF983 family [Jannaschia faecimaris]
MTDVASQTETFPETQTEGAERPMVPAMLRGWRRRCPNCGSGPMLKGYLKVRDACPVCDQALHHHRADDGPPYLTLLIVGHIIGPAMLWFFVAYEPDPYTFMAIFMVAATALSLWFLPRLKGMLVAIQWAARMGGFGQDEPPSDISK